jgi:long-subunit fatty acid transport protein
LPCNQVYVQATASYVLDDTQTPSDKQAPKRITDSQNDYFTANLTIGYALDDKTDVRFGYSYYTTNNYELPYQTGATAGPGSVGFGTETQENVFSISLARRINPNMIWNMGYAFYNSNTDSTDQTGGYSDFDAHLVSTGLQVRF